MKIKLLFSICFLAGLLQANAQFAPAAGLPGSTAIFKDSSVFVGWATGCTVIRGLQDVSNPGLGYASAGDSSMAVGIAGTNGVVSLGDGGSAILTFTDPVINGPGNDFAIFENSFDDYFLELAFVEVSSDGINYFRFHSTSLSDTSVQVSGFGQVDATNINNLAGKYRALYGTPFDLEELKNEPGLDVNNITHVRIIDVVGCIQDEYARYDFYGNKINDPWSTPFSQGGFDLDAVGLINTLVNIKENEKADDLFSAYPNPLRCGERIFFKINETLPNDVILQLFDLSGRLLIVEKISKDIINFSISSENLKPGVYWLSVDSGGVSYIRKIVIIST